MAIFLPLSVMTTVPAGLPVLVMVTTALRCATLYAALVVEAAWGSGTGPVGLAAATRRVRRTA